MKRSARIVLVGTCLSLTACNGGDQTPPPEPTPSLATPTPKAVLLVTQPKGSGGASSYYWGTILNDVPPQSTETPAAPGETEPKATVNAAALPAVETAPAGRPVAETPGNQGPRGAKAITGKAEGATLPTDAPSPPLLLAVGNYRADTPLAFRFKDMDNRQRLGVTSFGEVVFLIQGKDLDLPRITLWNPAKSIAEEVTILQNRKGSSKGKIFYDAINDQLVFTQTDKEKKTHLMTRALDGKEAEVVIDAANSGYKLDGLIPVGDGYAILNYSSSISYADGMPLPVPSPTPPLPKANKVHLVNLKGKAIQTLCEDCTNFLASQDPQAPYAYYVFTKDGEQRLVNLLDGQARSLATQPADGKSVVSVVPAHYLTATREILFRRKTTPIGGDAAGNVTTVELVVLDAASGTMRTLITWAEPTINELKAGPKLVTQYWTAVAHAGDRYLLSGGDDRCETSGNGKSCESITTHYSWLGADGKIAPIAKYDWDTDFVAYAAKSNRLVLASHGDVHRLLVVDAGTGKELAHLERTTHAPIGAYGKGATADWSWENRESLLTLHQTVQEGEYEVGVLNQYQTDHWTDGATLAPAVIATVQGTLSQQFGGAAAYAIDWAAGKARGTVVAPDTTAAPEPTATPVTPPTPQTPPSGSNAYPKVDAAKAVEVAVTKTGTVSVTQYLSITDPEGDPIETSMGCPGLLGGTGFELAGLPIITAEKNNPLYTHSYSMTFNVTDLALVAGKTATCSIQTQDFPLQANILHSPVTFAVTFTFKVNAPAGGANTAPTLVAANFDAAKFNPFTLNTTLKSLVMFTPDGKIVTFKVTDAETDAVKVTIECPSKIGAGDTLAAWAPLTGWSLKPNPTVTQTVGIKYTYTKQPPAGGTQVTCSLVATDAKGAASAPLQIKGAVKAAAP